MSCVNGLKNPLPLYLMTVLACTEPIQFKEPCIDKLVSGTIETRYKDRTDVRFRGRVYSVYEGATVAEPVGWKCLDLIDAVKDSLIKGHIRSKYELVEFWDTVVFVNERVWGEKPSNPESPRYQQDRDDFYRWYDQRIRTESTSSSSKPETDGP